MASRKLFLTNMVCVCMVFVLASASFIITVAQDYPQTLELGEGCSPESYRYVNESAFQENLNASFASLALNISSSNTSFFATSFSNNSDTDDVYALFLCRKYLTSQECLQCFTAAEKSLKEKCSNQGFNGGRIHMDGCFLRYENSSGFFKEATDGGFSTYCASSNAIEPQEFNQTAGILLSELTVNSSLGDGYAVGDISNASTPLYGLVQCVPTLSVETCQECLKAAQTLVVSNCLPMQEGRGLEGGCFMRYANYSFYSNFTSTTSKSSRNFKTWPILLATVGASTLLTVLW